MDLFETLQALLDAIAALAVDLSDEDRAAQIGEMIATRVAPENLPLWRAEAVAASQAIIEDGVTDESLVTLTVLRDATASIVATETAATEAAAERTAEAERLAAEIRGSDTPPEGDPVEDDPAVDDPDAPPAEDPPVEETPPVEDLDADLPAVDEADPVAVAASARQRAIRAAARRPGAVRMPGQRIAGAPGSGILPDDIGEWGLVASANAGGAVIRTREDVANAFLTAVNASRAMAPGAPPVNVNLFTMGSDGSPDALHALGYDEDRILGRDSRRNLALVEAACGTRSIMGRGGFESITASGGICAPQQVNYDQMTLGSSSRPVRDEALVRFGADRGGIRMFPPVIMEDVEGSIGVWDDATDTTPGSNTKPCLSLTCPDDDEALVAAITRCLTIGNFRSRYFGEQVEAWLRMAAVWQARVSERRLLTQISADSDLVSYAAQTVGTCPEIIAGLELAQAGMRSSRRLDSDIPLRWIVPAWLPDQMAADQARSMPAGSLAERFALSDSEIRSWLSARSITPTFALDGPAGQEFTRQGDGPLEGWPSTAVTWLYPDGYHLFLDGGQLDFGIVRDHILNSTNDFQMFAESMEGHFFHGDISYELTFDTCPSGARAALVDNSGVCVAGS